MDISESIGSDLARILMCGSVDDGKSTLIGRLLLDSGAVYSDHLRSLEIDSRTHGTRRDGIDAALLLDGLQSEREQGITIDVAYRHFTAGRRRIILADSPGHEQYTRNMATGASTADIAVILVDARKGLLPQTHRHLMIASLFGIRTVVLAVNKMDLVDWSQDVFDSISSECRRVTDSLGVDTLQAIPVCAVEGDNVVAKSKAAPWYDGPTLVDLLETLPIQRHGDLDELRLPIQMVSRPDQDFRGFSGTVAAGRLRVGEAVRVMPSGIETHVTGILDPSGTVDMADAGDAVTVTLADDVDVARGDVLCAADSPTEVADVFQATIVWMHNEPMLPGRTYFVKLATRTVQATFERPRYRIEPTSLEHIAADTLQLNDIAVCRFSTNRPLPFDPYVRNRTMGGFIVIDRHSNATLGAGMIDHSMRRSQNVVLQRLDIDKAARRQQFGHGSAVIWLTGLSGAGKSTIANALERLLHSEGVHTYLLDGDNVRHGLNRDLGFTPADRVENIRRVGEVAALMVDAGLVVICAFISPYAAERELVRSMVSPGEFIEVFVDAPLEVAESRDPKGLYARARAGEISNFTGIDAPYERPTAPDVRVDTSVTSADGAAQLIADLLRTTGIV